MLSKAEWAAGSMVRPNEGRLRCESESEEPEADDRWPAPAGRGLEAKPSAVDGEVVEAEKTPEARTSSNVWTDEGRTRGDDVSEVVEP